MCLLSVVVLFGCFCLGGWSGGVALFSRVGTKGGGVFFSVERREREAMYFFLLPLRSFV